MCSVWRCEWLQVPEADDLWEEIQDAQDAVALRALWELRPKLTEEYQLPPALRCAPLYVPVLNGFRSVPGVAP